MARPTKNNDVTFTGKEKDAGEELKMGESYQPIATELADDDERFQNKNSTVERPNDLVFTPQAPTLRIPTDVMIKSLE